MLKKQLEELVSRGFAVKTDETTYVMQKVCATFQMRPDLPGIPPHEQKESPMSDIQVGDTVSYSGLVDDNDKPLTEYGVVVCIFPAPGGYGKDAYVAFTGFVKPQSIKEHPEEKPYILRYGLESLKGLK